MSSEIIVALLSLAGTVLGTLSGILIANRLSNYRIGQLEIKVDKHNTLIERMYQAEGQINNINTRLNNMKEEMDLIRDEK